jgi:hydroxyacylglutathione hydrolase
MELPFRVVPVTAYQQNCTVVKCPESGDIAIIDPGGELDKIQTAIEDLGGTAKKILLTHGHLDHVGGTLPLSKLLDLPIIGPHKDDEFWIQQLPMQAQMLGLPPVQSFEPDQWLKDGDEISLGKLKFEVIHCPGHTPGHVVLFCREHLWAQVGDVIFQGSIGRTDFPRSNHQQLLNSIRDKLFPLGDEIQFVPGHGPMSTFGRERQSNPFVGDRAMGVSQ